MKICADWLFKKSTLRANRMPQGNEKFYFFNTRFHWNPLILYNIDRRILCQRQDLKTGRVFKSSEIALSSVVWKLSIFSDFFIPYFLFPSIVHGSKWLMETNSCSGWQHDNFPCVARLVRLVAAGRFVTVFPREGVGWRICNEQQLSKLGKVLNTTETLSCSLIFVEFLYPSSYERISWFPHLVSCCMIGLPVVLFQFPSKAQYWRLSAIIWED